MRPQRADIQGLNAGYQRAACSEATETDPILGTRGDTLGISGDQVGTNGDEWGVGEGGTKKDETKNLRMKEMKDSY